MTTNQTPDLRSAALDALRRQQAVLDNLGADSLVQPYMRTSTRQTMAQRSAAACQAYADAIGSDVVTVIADLTASLADG